MAILGTWEEVFIGRGLSGNHQQTLPLFQAFASLPSAWAPQLPAHSQGLVSWAAPQDCVCQGWAARAGGVQDSTLRFGFCTVFGCTERPQVRDQGLPNPVI
jgi:hypothetical protein